MAKPFRLETIFDTLAEHLRVRYRYEEPASGKTPVVDGATVLTAKRLAALPARHRRDLYEALAAGDLRAAEAASEQIRNQDEALGVSVLAEIRAFRLDGLLSLLEQIAPEAEAPRREA